MLQRIHNHKCRDCGKDVLVNCICRRPDDHTPFQCKVCKENYEIYKRIMNRR